VRTCDAAKGIVDTPVNCEDGNKCTVNYCHPQKGCQYIPKFVSQNCAAESSRCNGHALCLKHLGQRCLQVPTGTCKSELHYECNPSTGLIRDKDLSLDACDDGNPCTVDRCDSTTNQCVHEGVKCVDNDVCTINKCKNGVCDYSEKKNCDDCNPCTVDSCDAVLGCQHTPLSCNDNNACTIDRCDSAKDVFILTEFVTITTHALMILVMLLKDVSSHQNIFVTTTNAQENLAML
jgi:hypothetical protein